MGFPPSYNWTGTGQQLLRLHRGRALRHILIGIMMKIHFPPSLAIAIYYIQRRGKELMGAAAYLYKKKTQVKAGATSTH